MNTDIRQLYVTALSEYTPAVAEALLLVTPVNVWAIIATLLHVPGESGAPQAAIQRVSDDQDPDSEKHELADKERELRVLPRRGTISPWSSKATDILGREIVYCIAFVDDFTIPQFRPLEHKQIIDAGSNRMAEPCTNRPLREAPIHDSADGDELARPIRNIKAAQL
ncbi:hypothetical protein H4R23_002191 [Coemansia sp. Cherry 401B]|nr:hypothetical protein H4R23_002191 [Coemansia sp. Cherry 401B]